MMLLIPQPRHVVLLVYIMYKQPVTQLSRADSSGYRCLTTGDPWIAEDTDCCQEYPANACSPVLEMPMTEILTLHKVSIKLSVEVGNNESCFRH